MLWLRWLHRKCHFWLRNRHITYRAESEKMNIVYSTCRLSSSMRIFRDMYFRSWRPCKFILTFLIGFWYVLYKIWHEVLGLRQIKFIISMEIWARSGNYLRSGTIRSDPLITRTELNILINLILSFSRIDGKLKRYKQFNAFDVDIHVATLIARGPVIPDL